VNRIHSCVFCLTFIFHLASVGLGQEASKGQSDSHAEVSPVTAGAVAPELDPHGAAILHKAQDALGGLRRLQAIHDVTREVEMVNLTTKGKARSTSQIIFPDVIRLTTDSPFGQLIAFCDGQAAWESSSFGSDNRLPDWQIKASRQDLFRQLESLVQSDRNPERKIEFVERGKVNGRPADILKISSASTGTVRVWVDAASGNLLEMEYQRVVARGEGPLVTDFFSEYRWVNKTVRVPFHIHTLSDGQPYMDTQVLHADYNGGLKVEVLNQKPPSKQH
jgi:hypothetical protein